MVISIYGENFLRRMRNHYPLNQEPVDRAWFYAAYLEIEWALHGVQNPDPE